MFILNLRENLSESLSKVIGAPANQIALILTMLCIFPFCVLNYFIHGKYPRLIYSLVLGLLFQFSIYKLNFLHIFISAFFTYEFIKLYGRKYSAFYVFISSLLYLSFLHIKRMFEDYGGWKIDDPTTIYMMSICKFSSLAFSYEDGGKDIKDLKNNHHKEYRVVNKPTLLEVLSFIYFYPTSILGPSIEYKDFINFINETDCYSDLNNNIYYIFKNGLFYFLFSIFLMGFYAIVSNKLPIGRFVEKEFGNHSLLYTLAYVYFCIPAIRSRYYAGWILSYSALIFSGLSYTEKKDKDGNIVKTLEKGDSGSVIKCQFGINPKDIINEWNKTTHLWLKYNVYTRVINIEHEIFKDNWSLASFLTFISSAFWHGYYLTYYLTFTLLYCYQNACVKLDKKGLYDWIHKNKFLIPFASIFNNLTFESIGIIFFSLEWDKAVIGIKNMRYYPLIVVFGLYIITKFMKIPKNPVNATKKIEQKKKEKEKKVE